MTYLDTTRFAHLQEDEVLQRIGALLATALVRSGRLRTARGAPSPEHETKSSADDPARLIADPTEQQVVRFLARTGPASPRELGKALGLTRRTVARKLARLRASGLCEVTGKTKTARYRLRTECGQN